jgi:hypothetical protein
MDYHIFVNSKHTLVLKYNSKLIINSYIYNKLNKYRNNEIEYHILVDEYIRLVNDIKNVLVGYKTHAIYRIRYSSDRNWVRRIFWLEGRL